MIRTRAQNCAVPVWPPTYLLDRWFEPAHPWGTRPPFQLFGSTGEERDIHFLWQESYVCLSNMLSIENERGGKRSMSVNEHEKTYWNKEVAKQLGIADSTLRRWCGHIEESGYEFLKDDMGNRAFRDHEVIMLRRIFDLNKTKGVKLENAITVVLEDFVPEKTRDQTTLAQTQNDPRSQHELVPLALIEKFKQQEAMITQQTALIEVLIQMEQQRTEEYGEAVKKIDELQARLDQRDQELQKALDDVATEMAWRDEKFQAGLKEISSAMQERDHQLAASLEQIYENDQQKRPWWRFWG